MKRIVAISMILSLLASLAGMVGYVKEGHAATGAFVHPGILHTQADFDRMTQMVNAGTQPYLDGYNQLVNSSLSSSNWPPRATETIIRGGTGDRCDRHFYRPPGYLRYRNRILQTRRRKRFHL